MAFDQARERAREKLDATLEHLRSVSLLVDSLLREGSPSIIVCGASRLGRLAAARLHQAGIVVKALTDRLVASGPLGGLAIPIVPLPQGLALAPEAAVIAAVASASAVEREIDALCAAQGLPHPAVYRVT
jgi:hypothetical protein